MIFLKSIIILFSLLFFVFFFIINIIFHILIELPKILFNNQLLFFFSFFRVYCEASYFFCLLCKYVFGIFCADYFSFLVFSVIILKLLVRCLCLLYLILYFCADFFLFRCQNLGLKKYCFSFLNNFCDKAKPVMFPKLILGCFCAYYFLFLLFPFPKIKKKLVKN